MPSFDVVSKTDLMEVDNAINGAKREIKQRYDLAGTKCDISRSENTLTITADDTMKLTQVEELLYKYLIRRKVDRGAFAVTATQDATGDSIRQTIDIGQGIEGDLARKISKAVKGSKLKVQVQIQGSELHMSGKKRDDLQSAIAFIKEMNIKQPLQYVNYRD